MWIDDFKVMNFLTLQKKIEIHSYAMNKKTNHLFSISASTRLRFEVKAISSADSNCDACFFPFPSTPGNIK